MKILITGGAGFIGSNLVRRALAAGHCVVNYDKLTYAGCPQSLADVEHEPGYRFIHGDICDSDALVWALAENRPDAVMDLAAESHVDRSIDGPGDFVKTNLFGTYTLLEACRRYWADVPELRVLHVSTDEVFGSLGAEGKFSEGSNYDPSSPYSATKAGGDHLVRAWHRTYGLAAMITNCSNNYGPYQFPEKLIPHIILTALEERPLPVYGDGGNVRDWIHVEDHCDALLAVIERGKPGETYAIGADGERTNIEVVRTICSVLDELRPRENGSYSDLISFVKDRPGHDRRYAIDSSKIRRELGWAPRVSFEDGIRKTVEWYLERSDWTSAVLSGEYRLERIGGAK